MVSKSDFAQNGRRQFNNRGAQYLQKQFHKKNTGVGFHSKMSPNNNDFSNDINVMFNASQIPVNPGYIDFNDPSPPIPEANAQQKQTINSKDNSKTNEKPSLRNNNIKPNHRRTGQSQRNINYSRNQHPNSRGQQQIMNPTGPMPPPLPTHRPHGFHRFGGIGRGHFNPGMNMPHRPMLPPLHGGCGPRGPIPLHIPPGGGSFQPIHPPMRPPMHPGHNMPPFIRRSNVGAPIPPPLPPSQLLQRNRRNGFGQVGGKFNNGVSSKANITKLAPQSQKIFKPANRYMMITLREIGTQYQMDRPFVTDDIRVVYAKKLDIENRLKGKKDDKLFAEFKEQRDKFVALYDAAREKHLSKLKSDPVVVAAGTDDNTKKEDKDQTKNTTAETDIKKEDIQSIAIK